MQRAIGTVRAIVGLVLVVGLVVGGAFATGTIGMPHVTGVENRFSAVSDETTTIDTELAVENPNFFAIELGGVSVDYTVELNEVRFANGSKDGVNLSTGNATLPFRTTMSNQQIPVWWVAHIRDGETSHLVVNARVRSSTFGRTASITPVNREISTDLLGAFDSTEPRPVNANQPIVSDPILYINETSAQWGSVSEDETPIRMTFDVYNPKTTPFTITALGYDVTMNGVPVGDGEVPQGTTIPGKSQRTLEAATVIQNEELDAWWVTHLERNQVTGLRIDFYARIDLPAGQTIRVPLDALTYTETMETDIFGTKNGTATTGDPTPTPDGDGGSTTTDGDGESTTRDDGRTTATTGSETTGTSDGGTTETDDGGLL